MSGEEKRDERIIVFFFHLSPFVVLEKKGEEVRAEHVSNTFLYCIIIRKGEGEGGKREEEECSKQTY